MMSGSGCMTRRGLTGAKYEVDQALKQIIRIGESKKQAKAKGEKGYIHSYSQLKQDYSNSMEYAKWLRSDRSKGLYQANTNDYRDYIAHKSATVSNGHLINIETSLRHLSNGMNKISETRGRASREWIPQDRIVTTREREKPVDRSYTSLEIQAIKQNLPTNSKVHNNEILQNAFGMRLSETSKVLGRHFETHGNTTYFIASNNSKLTKGGRGRMTPCDSRYESSVRSMLSNIGPNQHVAAKYNTAKDAYRTAATKAFVSYNGSHGYRHSYARNQLNDKLSKHGITEKGREVIDRMIANHEAGYNKNHGFLDSEKNLYYQVNGLIDQVHESLGHGRGRIDLVAVYMK
jgi:hypothetical protein